MIRPLRQRHRIMVIALSVVVPTAFAIGIATRREAPVSRSPGQAETRNERELWRRDDLWNKPAIQTRLLKSGADDGQLAVELVSIDRIVRPDVLVYWLSGARRIQDTLPDDAFLLGRFEQATPLPLILPGEAAKQTGELVLYSLADHEILVVSKSFSAK